MTMTMTRARVRLLGWGVVAVVLPALMGVRGARGQGFLVDRRPQIAVGRSYEVREVSVDTRIRDQVAEVQVSQTFHNPGSIQIEAEYTFPLPEEGTVQSFVLLVDGREWPGRILPRDEARRIYEDIVRTKRDPALLEYMGRGMFRTSVFPIPPGADRKVTLRYTQVCKRDGNVVEFGFPFSTQKFTTRPIQRLALHVDIASRDAIKSVYCPSDDLDVERQGEHEARLRLVRHDVVPRTDFRLVYTLAEGALGASVLSTRPSASDDGYFLLLASPEVKPPDDQRHRPKTVVFVLDRSGSMAGKKLEQAKGALRFVLENLREDDTFNIVVYDDRVEMFQPELQRYSSKTLAEARRFVDNLREGGSTNINEALKTALRQIPDSSRPAYVLFLTDGLPTAGETNELGIAENCRKANDHRARLFVFGVGFDVNARLLDRISGGNSGTSTYVKPDDDIETQVARFYSKMTSPVLADIRLEFDGTDVNRVYPRDLPDLFEGGQLIVAGRYRDSGRTTLRISGRVGDERRRFTFPVDLASPGEGSRHDHVERLWAVRRVGFLIDQIDLHGRSKELVDELVSLSTRYGILTPYTSFLADENISLHAQAANVGQATDSLRELETVSGAGGVGQRLAKRSYLDSRVAGNQAGQSGPAAAMGGGMGGRGGALEFRFDQQQGAQQQGAQKQGASSAVRGRGLAEAPAMPALGMKPAQRPEANAPGFALAYKDAEGRDQAAATVRQVGSKTFYYKDNGWVDSTVNADEVAKATVITQFSDDYFTLARTQPADRNQFLTFTERVTVKIGGKVYRIEPVTP